MDSITALEERIVALEAQLTTRGACECGADQVCALARRAQEVERCPHTAPDENEQPTDDPCPFGRPCPFHDAREVRRG